MFLVDVQNHPYIVNVGRKSPQEDTAFMDSFGCSMAVLTNQLPPPDDAHVQMYRQSNDELLSMSRSFPDRLIAAPAIPIHSGKAAMDEVDRVASKSEIRALGIRPIHGRIDNDELDSFYQRVSDLGVPLLVHPNNADPVYGPLFAANQYKLATSLEFAVDSTIAIGWLIHTGLLERFPSLKLVFHHLGGAAPFLLGRMEALFDESRSTIPRRPTDYLRMLYLDTVSYDQRALELTLDIMGADHLLFGTDYGCPCKGLVQPQLFIRMIDQLKIPPAEKAKIFGGNAARIFGLKSYPAIAEEARA